MKSNLCTETARGCLAEPDLVTGRSDRAYAPEVACDLANARAFYPDANTPPLPVLMALGAGPLHQCRLEGAWELERAVAENSGRVVRSFREVRAGGQAGEWKDLIFELGGRAFLCADQRRIVGYAETAAAAEQVVKTFAERYAQPPAAASFHLLNQTGYGITTEAVKLPPESSLTAEMLELHYGQGAAAWHGGFLAKLQTRRSGLSILEGPPGTGKTSYLRHLASVLRGSHRFYFVPPGNLHMLSRPDFTGFWSDQRRIHSELNFVVILEDADEALAPRGGDNRDQVSTILNLSDGMMGDFLRLQIICTINADVASIDEALRRPGRLLCHRYFGRLAFDDAVRLAAGMGRQLREPGEYSLAEIFAGESNETSRRQRIGFGG